LHRGPLEWHYLRTKFHENLPSGSKVISGGHSQTDCDLISLLSFLESRLKKVVVLNALGLYLSRQALIYALNAVLSFGDVTCFHKIGFGSGIMTFSLPYLSRKVRI